MHKEELKQQKDLLKAVLKNNEIRVCEYLVKEDKLIIYDEALMVEREIPNYLKRLEQNSSVCPEDLWKMREFLRGRASSGVEVRIVQGKKTFKRLFQVLSFDGIDPSVRVPVIIRDTTRDEYREALLEDRATKDALTMLYNHFFGRELINEYLKNKDPYASCGLMLMDIDYFKYANDTYGHLFGDRVLIQVAEHGLKNPDDAKAVARHEVLCTLDDILRESMRLLQDKGRFYMIHRPFRLTEILIKMNYYKIEPKRIQFIYPYIDKEPAMVLIEGVRGAKPRVTVEPPIIIYDQSATK